MIDLFHNPLRWIGAAVLTLLVAFGCGDREPPQFDDEQKRHQIEAQYQTVHDRVDTQRVDADEQLVEGREHVEDIGEIEFPDVELDDLLDGDDDE